MPCPLHLSVENRLHDFHRLATVGGLHAVGKSLGVCQFFPNSCQWSRPA
jgi:hypothetical protein